MKLAFEIEATEQEFDKLVAALVGAGAKPDFMHQLAEATHKLNAREVAALGNRVASATIAPDNGKLTEKEAQAVVGSEKPELEAESPEKKKARGRPAKTASAAVNGEAKKPEPAKAKPAASLSVFDDDEDSNDDSLDNDEAQSADMDLSDIDDNDESDENETGEITVHMLKDLTQQMFRKMSSSEVVKLIKENASGVSSVSAADPKDYPALYAAFKKAVGK